MSRTRRRSKRSLLSSCALWLAGFAMASSVQGAEPLSRIFMNMGGANLDTVRNVEAWRQANSGTPSYPSNMANETVVFEGEFRPASNATKLAIFSDDGCTVEIDGTVVPGCDRAGEGQHLPDLGQSFVEISYTFTAGQSYFISVTYTNTIHPAPGEIDTDNDGCTLFAYDGGGASVVAVDRIILAGSSDPEDEGAILEVVGELVIIQAMPRPESDSFPPGQPTWTVLERPAGATPPTLINGRSTQGILSLVEGTYRIQATADGGSDDIELQFVAANKIAASISPEKVTTGYKFVGGAKVGFKRRLKITVTPKDELNNFTVDPGNISIGPDMGTGRVVMEEIGRVPSGRKGIITVEIAGDEASNPRIPNGDVVVEVNHPMAATNPLDRTRIKVVVPKTFEKATLNVRNKSVTNIMKEFTDKSSPVANPLPPPGFKQIGEFCGFYQRITVLDQYGEKLDTVYNGVRVSETLPEEPDLGEVDINQPITDGRYSDPVGSVRNRTFKAVDFSLRGFVPSQDAWFWKETNTRTVLVGGHTLSPAMVRKYDLRKEANTNKGKLDVEYAGP